MSDKNKEFIRLQLLKLLAENPQRSQRELSKLMGIALALGRVNYCLSGLIDKGYIKLGNLRNSENRILYVYHLTPAGLDAKLKLTFQFLKRRLEEYTRIKIQIQELATDLSDNAPELLKDMDTKGLFDSSE
ncbi:MarR family EPS-associated transcriptional regulator [Desulfobacter latus]|uniref:MarR family EPS-associated transcriptional regulator n=1 Tax=Desulfobacter latus TaxID=2292 RepID=A0A850TF81_9BACT|nr:MarR family EPS-associated transcriptional regulator [Desulfobacter latus]NWH06947.1 MarR family EPS-associated transcriptional regulator [Desulfobacter latus]